MQVTPGYLAVLALLYLVLAARTILLRRRFSVAVGAGNERTLERAVRAHGNFAEYVPLTLFATWLVELDNTVGPFWIHLLCSALVLGLGIHAYGISQRRERFAFRVTGMSLTLTVLAADAVLLLVPRALH